MNSQLATKEEKRAYFLHLLQEVVPTLMRIEKVAFKALREALKKKEEKAETRKVMIAH
jgi:hypothetical protein